MRLTDLENKLMVAGGGGRGQEEGMARDLGNQHVLGQTSGEGEGQGGLVCCSPWGHRESSN